SRLRKLCNAYSVHAPEPLTSEHFDCLLSLFSNSDWLAASARKDLKQKEQVEKLVLRKLRTGWTAPFPIQNVYGLMQIVHESSQYFLLGIPLMPVWEAANV